MDLVNANKSIVAGLTGKTTATVANNDLIQLYANDGTPNGKISRTDFMDMVKASLPGILSDQGTSGTSFPSIASGVLGSMSAANLASVLGVGEPILLGTHNPVGQDKWVKVAQMYYLQAQEGVAQTITFMLAGGDNYVTNPSVGIYSFSHHGSGSIHVAYKNLQLAHTDDNNRRHIGYVIDTANECVDIYCKAHSWNSFVYVYDIQKGSADKNRIIREPNYTTTEPAGIVYLTNDNVVSTDIPDFYKDYSTLSALTTAVRGVPPIGAFSGVQDLDNITETCWSYIWSNNYGLMPVVTFVQDATSAFQIYIRDQVHIDFRYKWNGDWEEWHTIV